MRNGLLGAMLVLVASAFCAASAFAETQGVGQVIYQHDATVLQKTQGTGAQHISEACKTNPNLEGCPQAQSAIKSHRNTVHDQRMQKAHSQQ